jgi:hypothetical protein
MKGRQTRYRVHPVDEQTGKMIPAKSSCVTPSSAMRKTLDEVGRKTFKTHSNMKLVFGLTYSRCQAHLREYFTQHLHDPERVHPDVVMMVRMWLGETPQVYQRRRSKRARPEPDVPPLPPAKEEQAVKNEEWTPDPLPFDETFEPIIDDDDLLLSLIFIDEMFQTTPPTSPELVVTDKAAAALMMEPLIV